MQKNKNKDKKLKHISYQELEEDNASFKKIP